MSPLHLFGCNKSREINAKEELGLSDLIYSKEFKDDLEDDLDMYCYEDSDNHYRNFSGELSIQRIENGLEITFPGIDGPVLRRIEHVPDMTRKKGSERFISGAKSFSRRYEVTLEIYNNGGSISAWFYFSSETLEGARKKAFGRLFNLADEACEIPYPKGRDAWYECAIILTYRTHFTTVNGKLLDQY